MNKKIGLLLSSLVIFSFLIANVSAAFYYDARTGMQTLIESVVNFSEPLLQVLLGGGDWSGYLLFEKLVIFLLIAAIVYVAIDKTKMFDENKPVLWIITIAIPLLAIRWINFEWLNYIITQYQVLGVSLVTILPFLIYLFFLHGASHATYFRRVGWVLYILVYYGLWTTNSSVGVVSQAYFWTIIVAIVSFIFDPAIHRLMTRDEDIRPLRVNITHSIASLDHQLTQLEGAHHISEEEKRKMKKYLEKQIADRQKELAKL